MRVDDIYNLVKQPDGTVERSKRMLIDYLDQLDTEPAPDGRGQYRVPGGEWNRTMLLCHEIQQLRWAVETLAGIIEDKP